ncbi:MAG: hypothetical protein Q9203_006113 [Teloschistes exilis]
MDESRSTSAFKSKVFEILVGPSAEPFFAHADILSKCGVLRKEVEGLWNENSGKKIVWNDWTVNGADKFLEWLYTDDYTCPYPVAPTEDKPTEDPEASGRKPDIFRFLSNDASSGVDDRNMEAPVEASDLPAVEWASEIMPVEEEFPADLAMDQNSLKKVECEATPNLEEYQKFPALQDLNWTGCRKLHKTSQAEEYENWTGRIVWKPAELDYESTFMTHAQVYIMACYYLVDGLKNMAWQRLRAVLISIGTPQRGSRVVGNLVKLIQYVYGKTGPCDADNNDEPLRELVSTFMALHLTQLRGPEVDDLWASTVESDREFVVDCMSKVVRRVQHLEARGIQARDVVDTDSPFTPGKHKKHKGRRTNGIYGWGT